MGNYKITGPYRSFNNIRVSEEYQKQMVTFYSKEVSTVFIQKMFAGSNISFVKI